MWDPPEDYLALVSDAAALALMLGAANWVLARLAPFVDDPLPAQALSAGWAYMLEPRACHYYEPPNALWRGPIRGPVAVATVILMDALHCRDAEPEVRLRTHWMANLARHILGPDGGAFDQWFDWAALTLAQLHPRSEIAKRGLFDDGERLEPAVGPSVLVPDSGYDQAQSRREIHDMLMSTSRDNPLIDHAALLVSLERSRPDSNRRPPA
ncbi:MAG: hypothetical protein KC457_16545 [Myxococcales bacterium]|nr:hypothetical protein [Myxococcales bacterium]